MGAEIMGVDQFLPEIILWQDWQICVLYSVHKEL